MNGELWASGESSFTKPQCGKQGSATLHSTVRSYAGTAMVKNNQNNSKNTNEQQLFLETKKRQIKSTVKLITPRAEEGYCYDVTPT